MPTVNKRTKFIRNVSINGVDSGGAMSARIQAGYDEILRSAPDGLALPVVDRATQFVRGSYTTQDWPTIISILTGTLATLVCYERKSGVAAATGWIKHTLTSPVIHRARISLTKGGHATASFDFECRFASEVDTIATTWAITDAQAEPAYVAAARGGWRIKTALHGAVPIYHVMSFEFAIEMPVLKECNDSDLGYTCVDADPEGGMTATGSIGFQDSAVTSSVIKGADLAMAARAALVLTVSQSGGAADKVITVAGVMFTGTDENAQSAADKANEHTASYEVCNSATVPLTLSGTNKIIAVADAA